MHVTSPFFIRTNRGRLDVKILTAAIAATLLLSSTAFTAETKILVPSGKKDAAKEEANRKLALSFWYEFFDLHRYETCTKYLAADFISHDRDEPSGAQAFCDAIKASERNMPAQTAARPQAFAIADGDLVMIGHPGMDGDGTENFAVNIVRIRDGKIVEKWFDQGGWRSKSKSQAGKAPATADPASKSR